jgi:c-di-GMP-binding flagellar brake protein YcgR
MSEFDERRKEPRKTVMKFTPVYDTDKGNLLGYLRDLTLQGALVIGEKTLKVNTQVTLKFDLPEELTDFTAKHLTISARVARCIEDESPNSYKLGFEFKDINPEQIKIIEAVLERYHFRHRRYEWQDPGAI